MQCLLDGCDTLTTAAPTRRRKTEPEICRDRCSPARTGVAVQGQLVGTRQGGRAGSWRRRGHERTDGRRARRAPASVQGGTGRRRELKKKRASIEGRRAGRCPGDRYAPARLTPAHDREIDGSCVGSGILLGLRYLLSACLPPLREAAAPDPMRRLWIIDQNSVTYY